MIAVRFGSVKRTRPAPLASSWPELVAVLSEHAENADKLAGALWSPVSYLDGARRGLAGVDRVFAFVADLDGHDLSEAWPATWIARDRRFGGFADHACRDCSRAYFMPQHAPGAVFDVVIGNGEPVAVPMVSSVEPVRRVAGKRAEPRRNGNRIPDEAWWNEPADLSRFDGMTERETLQTLYAE
jgi:hypothetical protein